MKQAQIGKYKNCAGDAFHGLKIAPLQVAWIENSRD